MGLEFVCLGKWVRKRHLDAPLDWLDLLSQAKRLHLRLLDDDVRANDRRSESRGLAATLGFHFGNSAFTPLKANLAQTEPIYDDRPYANLLYVKVRRASARRGGAVVSDLTLGVLGLNVGKWVQTTIHEAVDDTIPGGWGNQISDGGEPTLKYRVSPRWLLVSIAKKRRAFRADVAASAEANLGYYTNASAGARLRVGIVRSPWWSFAQRDRRCSRRASSTRGVRGRQPVCPGALRVRIATNRLNETLG